jgi:hypothetical protein
MGPVLVQPGVFDEVFCDHLDELDVFKAAADGDLDTLAVPIHENRAAF